MIRVIPIALALSAALTAQPDRIGELDEALRSARKDGNTATLTRLLHDAIWLDDKRVAGIVAPFMQHESDAVAVSAVKALRYHANPTSFKTLIAAERESRVRVRRDLRAEVLLAIGQSGAKKAIEPLVEAMRSTRDGKILNAAGMALGHVRDRRAVEEALKLATSSGRRGGRGGRGGRLNRMPQGPFLALTYLTAQTHGNDAGAWRKWWKENGRAFEVPRLPFGVGPQLERRYERTWAPPAKKPERQRRRS